MQEMTGRDNEIEQKEMPKTGLVVCGCGGKISDALDLDYITRTAEQIPRIVYVHTEAFPCSKEGRERLAEAIRRHKLERVIVAGCTPRLVEDLFQRTAESAALPGVFLEVVDIREQCAYVHADQAAASVKAIGLIAMEAARLSMLHPGAATISERIHSALVVGGGLEALTVALSLAENHIPVTLVDPQEESRSELFSNPTRAALLLEMTRDRVQQHALIHNLKGWRVREVAGSAGNYRLVLEKDGDKLPVQTGVVIVAAGAYPRPFNGRHWYDRSRVVTQIEYQAELRNAIRASNGAALSNLVIILCGEEPALRRCSRVCCVAGIRQALETIDLNPDAHITILFRELCLDVDEGAGKSLFEDAKAQGITFIRYTGEKPPTIGDRMVECIDQSTGERVSLPFDRVVLSTPLEPHDRLKSLSALLHLPAAADGFVIEPRYRLRPEQRPNGGIYVTGGAHQPVSLSEALYQAYLTAGRAIQFLKQEKTAVTAAPVEIDERLCSGCATCVQSCLERAIFMKRRDGYLSLAAVEAGRCIRCGNCVVACPVKAISLPGWEDSAILAQMQAAFQEGAAAGPKIFVFACEWSAYAAADLSGVKHLAYPINIRILRMNCSARFDPDHVLWALLNDVDGVLLGTCLPGECHYGSGNRYAAERFGALQMQLRERGINSERVQILSLAGDDGAGFAAAVKQFAARLEHPAAIPAKGRD